MPKIRGKAIKAIKKKMLGMSQTEQEAYLKNILEKSGEFEFLGDGGVRLKPSVYLSDAKPEGHS